MTPSIITIGIYYAFTTGITHSIKNIVKDTINKSKDLSFGKFNIGYLWKLTFFILVWLKLFLLKKAYLNYTFFKFAFLKLV